jgi:hypothetical protein
MSVAVGRETNRTTSTDRPLVQVLRKPVSSKLDDFGQEIRPHLPHACCSGEAGHCYPRIKLRS